MDKVGAIALFLLNPTKENLERAKMSEIVDKNDPKYYELVEFRGEGDRWLFKYFPNTKIIEWRTNDWYVDRISPERRKDFEEEFFRKYKK